MRQMGETSGALVDDGRLLGTWWTTSRKTSLVKNGTPATECSTHVRAKVIARPAVPEGHPGERGLVWRVFVKGCLVPPVLRSIMLRVPPLPSKLLVEVADSLVYPAEIAAAAVILNRQDALSYEFDESIMICKLEDNRQNSEAMAQHRLPRLSVDACRW